jgi:ribosome recycling factor
VIKDILTDAENRMRSAIQVLHDDLAGIRTGRASPALVEKLPIEYYGTPTPLQQLASISVPEPRTLTIKPFDATTLKVIEKAILISDLGLNPNNDGKVIHLTIVWKRRVLPSVIFVVMRTTTCATLKKKN